MCGRFSLVDGTRTVEKRFGGKYITASYESGYDPHPDTPRAEHPLYNAAPSMTIPIVIDHYQNTPGRTVVPAIWGLTLAHAEYRPQANARIDTINERKMFRSAFTHRHCLVPANSFFEWRREKRVKQPYLIHPTDQDLFAFAGIWETGFSKDDPPTFTLLTTEANEMMSKIHDRMPVILRQSDENKWLTAVGNGMVYSIDWQYPSAKMEMYPVTPAINKVSFNEPQAIERIPEPSLGI